MSDGERAIFYLIGQVLVAEKDSMLIVDEPELHVHRSIISKLWDELEAARPDCAFVFITHDLEFAATRGGKKYILSDYRSGPYWVIEDVPEESEFGEEISTLILGSRRPILFVEGENNSLGCGHIQVLLPKLDGHTTWVLRGSDPFDCHNAEKCFFVAGEMLRNCGRRQL